jgi:hypothetical protein
MHGNRYASTAAVAILLAGCGGSQPPIGAPGVMPQSRAISTRAAQGRSHAAAGPATSGDLIYVSNGCGGVCVLSYPDGQVVSIITLSGSIGGDCSDSSGEVFVTNDTQVVEYARGDSSPIATYSVAGEEADACSVDPTSGNLAVVFRGTGANIAIFPPRSETPSYYNAHIDAYYCGYDADGNLFVDGLNGHDGGLSELSKGASDLNILSINGDLGTPGQVQWDSKYITVEGRASGKVVRLAISGSTATVVGTTRLKGKIANASQSWIYGNRVIVPYATRGRLINKVGVWKYPASGKPVSKFEHFSGSKFRALGGVTVSLAPHR